MALRVTQQYIEFVSSSTTETSDTRVTTHFAQVAASGYDYSPDLRVTTVFAQIAASGVGYTPPDLRVTTHFAQVAVKNVHRGFTSILGTPQSTFAGSTFILGTRASAGPTYTPSMTGKLGARASMPGRTLQIGNPMNQVPPPSPSTPGDTGQAGVLDAVAGVSFIAAYPGDFTPPADTGELGTDDSVLGFTMIPGYPAETVTGPTVEEVTPSPVTAVAATTLGTAVIEVSASSTVSATQQAQSGLITEEADDTLVLGSVASYTLRRTRPESTLTITDSAEGRAPFYKDASNDEFAWGQDAVAEITVRQRWVSSELDDIQHLAYQPIKELFAETTNVQFNWQQRVRQPDIIEVSASSTLSMTDSVTGRQYPIYLSAENSFYDDHPEGIRQYADEKSKFRDANPSVLSLSDAAAFDYVYIARSELTLTDAAIQGQIQLWVSNQFFLTQRARWDPTTLFAENTLEISDYARSSLKKLYASNSLDDLDQSLVVIRPWYMSAESPMVWTEILDPIWDPVQQLWVPQTEEHDITQEVGLEIIAVRQASNILGFRNPDYGVTKVLVKAIGFDVQASNHLSDLSHYVRTSIEEGASSSLSLSQSVEAVVSKIARSQITFGLWNADVDEFHEWAAEVDPDVYADDPWATEFITNHTTERIAQADREYFTDGHRVHLNRIAQIFVEDTLELSQGMGFTLDNAKNRCIYTPFVGALDTNESNVPRPPRRELPPGAPPSILTNDRFRIVYPHFGHNEDFIDEITLRAPEFGNREGLQSRRIQRETMGGYLIIYRDQEWPQYFQLSYTFTRLTRSKKDDLLRFIDRTLGKEVGIQDHEGRLWRAFIVNPDNPAVHDIRGDCGWTITLDFEAEPLCIRDMDARCYLPMTQSADIWMNYSASTVPVTRDPIVEQTVGTDLEIRPRPAYTKPISSWDGVPTPNTSRPLTAPTGAKLEWTFGFTGSAPAVARTSRDIVMDVVNGREAGARTGHTGPIIEQTVGGDLVITPVPASARAAVAGPFPPAEARTGTSGPQIVETINWRGVQPRIASAETSGDREVLYAVNGRTAASVAATTDPDTSYEDRETPAAATAVAASTDPDVDIADVVLTSPATAVASVEHSVVEVITPPAASAVGNIPARQASYGHNVSPAAVTAVTGVAGPDFDDTIVPAPATAVARAWPSEFYPAPATAGTGVDHSVLEEVDGTIASAVTGVDHDVLEEVTGIASAVTGVDHDVLEEVTGIASAGSGTIEPIVEEETTGLTTIQPSPAHGYAGATEPIVEIT